MNYYLKFIVLVITLLCQQSILAQQQLSGQILDENGQEVFAANVFCKSQPEKGQATDLSGQFTLDVSHRNDTLVVQYIGYQKLQIPLQQFDFNKMATIEIRKKTLAFDQVLVTAKRPISEQFAVTKLNRLDIYVNPVAQGDPLKAITNLPASTTDDESANPSLRGSAQNRTRVILNEIPIYRPVRNSQFNGIGNFSIFNTALIKNQYVYASNPPLTFGNTSAGLVEIQTIDELENNQLQVSTTLASVGLMLSQKLNKKSFFQLYSNHQFAGAFLGLNKTNLEDLNDFGSTDIGLNVHLKLGKKTTLNTFSYAVKESYGFTYELFTYKGASTAGKKRIYTVNNLKHFLEKGVLSLNFGTNHSLSKFKFGALDSNNLFHQYYSSANYKHLFNDKLKIQTGLSFDHHRQQFNFVFPQYYYVFSPDAPVTESDSRSTLDLLESYFYLSWKTNSKWSFSAGLRKNLWVGSNEEDYLSTQIGARFKINSRQSILFSAGKYHNYVTPNFNAQNYKLLGARQMAIDYNYEKGKTQFKGAIYFKNETGDQFVDNDLAANQIRTFGLEFFWQQQLNRYLQFSLANSFIEQSVQAGNTKVKGRFDFNYFIKSNIQFMHPKLPSMTLSYLMRPGTFYTPVVHADYNMTVDFYEPVFNDILYADQYNNYKRLDLSFSKFFQLKGQQLVAFINVANLLNIENQSEVRYNRDYTQAHFAYYTKRTIYFGVVWSRRD